MMEHTLIGSIFITYDSCLIFFPLRRTANSFCWHDFCIQRYYEQLPKKILTDKKQHGENTHLPYHSVCLKFRRFPNTTPGSPTDMNRIKLGSRFQVKYVVDLPPLVSNGQLDTRTGNTGEFLVPFPVSINPKTKRTRFLRMWTLWTINWDEPETDVLQRKHHAPAWWTRPSVKARWFSWGYLGWPRPA